MELFDSGPQPLVGWALPIVMQRSASLCFTWPHSSFYSLGSLNYNILSFDRMANHHSKSVHRTVVY